MRKIRSLVACATVIVAGALAAPASRGQGPDKPVAIVSIAPVDRLMQDFTYLMRSCGVPQIGGIGSMMTKQYTQGLDSKRPAGVIVHMADGQPVPLAFLPLSDRDKFFNALAGAGQIPDDLGKGLYAFDAGGRTIYAKDASQWLFISQQEDDLKKLPADPAALLGDAANKYDIGIRINLQALPPELKEMAVSQMKAGFERSMAEQRGQSDEEKAAAEEMGKASMAQMERMLNETEQVLVGISAAPSQQRLQLDLGAQFVSGSDLATQVDKMKDLTSDFTGLLIPGAAATLRSTAYISEGDKTLTKANLRSALGQLDKQITDSSSVSPALKTALQKFMKGLTSVADKTIDSGKTDGGGAIALTDGKVRGVFGFALADGMQIEKEVKDLVAALGTGPEVPKFQFNYAKHQNVNLHKVSVPIKTDDPKVTKLFGSELKLVIGTAEKALFVSVDPDGDSVIKAALDRVNSTKNVKVTPGEVIVEAGQVVSFAQSLNPNPVLENVANVLAQSDGKDKVRIISSLVPRGLIYQVMFDEGVLKGIGAAVQAGQAGGGF